MKQLGYVAFSTKDQALDTIEGLYGKSFETNILTTELYKSAPQRRQEKEQTLMAYSSEKRNKFLKFKNYLLIMIKNCEFMHQSKIHELLKYFIKDCLVTTKATKFNDKDISNISMNIMGFKDSIVSLLRCFQSENPEEDNLEEEMEKVKVFILEVVGSSGMSKNKSKNDL